MKKIIILISFVLLISVFSLSFYSINKITSRNIAGRVIYPVSGKSEGGIYTISVEPEIKVLDESTVLVGVQNTANEKHNYKLYVFITKEGVIKESSDFSFSLKPSQGATFSLTFIPDSVGEHGILAKLYDEFEIKLLDTKTLNVKVTSDIGPFDLSLDILTRTIPPVETLPIILKMVNTGEKGSEVKVKVSMYCTNHTIGDEFFIFLKPNIETEKTISLVTCSETGLKKISAELVLFNTTFVTSSSQLFLKETPTLRLKIPEKIEVQAGGSKVLGIVVENDAGISVNNLKLLVEKIPSAWFDTEPFTIINVKPGEAVIFMLNLSIPEDAEAREYPIKIDIGGDEVFSTEKTTLRVFGVTKATEERQPKLQIFKTIKIKNLLFFAILSLVILSIIRKIVTRRSVNEIYKKRIMALQAIKR